MRRLYFACGLLALLGSCAAKVYSPPTSSFPIDSPATIRAKQQKVAVDAFHGGALFGPDVESGRATYARGLGKKLEVSASPALIWISGAQKSDSHPGIYSLRGGLKYAPFRHLALSSGLGVGASAGGAFFSPDLGASLGFENRYLVPFANARGLFSAPLGSKPVHFSTGDEASDGDGLPDRYRRRPLFTWGYQLAVGLKLPLEHNKKAATHPALACAYGLTALYNQRNHQHVYGGLGCGAEVVF